MSNDFGGGVSTDEKHPEGTFTVRQSNSPGWGDFYELLRWDEVGYSVVGHAMEPHFFAAPSFLTELSKVTKKKKKKPPVNKKRGK